MNAPALEELEILPSVVFEEVNGELELDSGSYYGLNQVGAVIFRALEQQLHLTTVVDDLQARYAVPRKDLEADRVQLIEGLWQAGLLRQRTA